MNFKITDIVIKPREAGLKEADIAELVEEEETLFKQQLEREERAKERVPRILESNNQEAEKTRLHETEEAEKVHQEAEKVHKHELELAQLDASKSSSNSHLSDAYSQADKVEHKLSGLRIPKFVHRKDDIDDFLRPFERIALAKEWPFEDYHFHCTTTSHRGGSGIVI